jgi:DNA-binding response OmpR family regulator
MLKDRDKALAAGCDEYIAKPVDFEELRDKLQRVLTRKSQQGPANSEPC